MVRTQATLLLQCAAIVMVESNSSSGRVFSSRRRLGRQRHVDTRFLWVQERVARGDAQLEIVGTDHNVSDLLTEVLGRADAQRHLKTRGVVFVGRGSSREGSV